MNMSYAPIILFAFNRLDTLRNTVQSLLSNPQAADSELYVFVDGARPDKPGETAKVKAVQDYVSGLTGFRAVHTSFAEQNKGLAPSVIAGVTRVFQEHSRVIVLEDDLYVSASFLEFMNEMLERYESDERIMQVSGFGCRLTRLGDYPYDVYLNERAHSWSWATWKDRWETVDWQVGDFEQLRSSRALQRRFNRRGSDLYGMLRDYMEGRKSSWYIRFNYAMYRQGRYSVMPVRSLVRNDGFGLEATNCSNYNRYKIDFEPLHPGAFAAPNRLEPCERIIRNSVRYWSIPYRIYGKLRTLGHKL